MSASTAELNFIFRMLQGAALTYSGATFNQAVSDGYITGTAPNYSVTQLGIDALQIAGYEVPTETGSTGTVPNDGIPTTYPITLTEHLTLLPVVITQNGLLVISNESMRIVGQVSPVYIAGFSVREAMHIRSQLAARGVYGIIVPPEHVLLRTTLVNTFIAMLTAEFKLSTSSAVAIATKLMDSVQVSALVSAQRQLLVKLAEQFGIATGMVPQLGVLIREAFLADDGVAWTYQVIEALLEQVELLETWTPSMVAMVLEREDVAFDDQSSLQMLYELLVCEGIYLGNDVALPQGGETTWAIHARTGSVSHYADWSFNSYARFGTTYIGVSMDGLYELGGDSDQLSPIIARVGKELVEMTGAHLTGLEKAYVALGEGSGRLYLKLEGGGKRTIYQVTAQTQRTSEVRLGKGWRSRFLSWELTSVGQDFTLASLEFIPIQFMRRVGK